jgi:hypothetical protein
MTKEELRAIVARDAKDRRGQVEADRGALLDLLHDLADAARRHLDAPKNGMGAGTITIEAEGRLRSLLRRVEVLRDAPGQGPQFAPQDQRPDSESRQAQDEAGPSQPPHPPAAPFTAGSRFADS